MFPHQVFINFAKQQQELVHATASHGIDVTVETPTSQRSRTRTDEPQLLSDLLLAAGDDDVTLLDDVNVDVLDDDDDDAALLLNQTGVRLCT